MWFRPETTDTRQFVRAVWEIVRWLIYGPALGGLFMLGFALLLGASLNGILNAMLWGAGFGVIAGVMVTGNRLIAHWKV